MGYKFGASQLLHFTNSTNTLPFIQQKTISFIKCFDCKEWIIKELKDKLSFFNKDGWWTVWFNERINKDWLRLKNEVEWDWLEWIAGPETINLLCRNLKNEFHSSMKAADNTTNQTPFINSQIDSFQLIDFSCLLLNEMIL